MVWAIGGAREAMSVRQTRQGRDDKVRCSCLTNVLAHLNILVRPGPVDLMVHAFVERPPEEIDPPARVRLPPPVRE